MRPGCAVTRWCRPEVSPRLAAIVVACALPVAVGAQVQRTGVASIGNYLSKMDADRDGRVSLGEYQDWLSYAVDGMDASRDGVLSPAVQPGGRGAALTRVEHRARLAERFRKQDANRDGFLSVKELAAPPR